MYKHCLSSSRNPKGFASYKSIMKASTDPDSQRRDTRAGVYVGKKVISGGELKEKIPRNDVRNSGGELKERIPRNDVRNAAIGMRW